MHSTYVCIYVDQNSLFYRYDIDVNQSSIRYSDVKSRDNTITNKYIKPLDPEYELVQSCI